MRVLKSLLLYALILFGVFSVIWLIFAPRESSNTTGSSGDDVLSEAISRIDAYAGSISNGWSDSIYSDALSYVDMKCDVLDRTNGDLLRDRLKTSFMESVCRLIFDQYGSHMRSGDLNRNIKLKRAYSAFDKLVADYPELKFRQSYVSVRDLRQAHMQIYSFGEQTYNYAPRTLPTIFFEQGRPVLHYGMPKNCSIERRSKKNELMRLRNLRAGVSALSSSPWTAESLSETRLMNKLDEAARVYHTAESQRINRFLGTVVSRLQREADSENRIEGLVEFKNSLRRMRHSMPAEISFDVEPIISQCDRIFK